MARKPRFTEVREARADDPVIHFYVPGEHAVDPLPTSIDSFAEASRKTHIKGAVNWTVQAYIGLSAADLTCDLVSRFPPSGLVIAHDDFLKRVRPGPDHFVICIKPDRGPDPRAQLHLVQNRHDPIFRLRRSLWPAAFIQYFPHPGLVPRDPARGDRFERVAHMGRASQLDPALQEREFLRPLEGAGLEFVIKDPGRWYDYSDVDCVLSVRSFSDTHGFPNKPASKLWNAWAAGVPPVLGFETAFRDESRSPYDFIEVNSPEAALEAVLRLRTDLAHRRQVIEAGRRRLPDVAYDRIVESWRGFFVNTAFPLYREWTGYPVRKRRLLNLMRWTSKQASRVHRLVGRALPARDAARDGSAQANAGSPRELR